MIRKYLLFFVVIFAMPLQDIKAQSSPYIFPEEIENLNFPPDIKPQVQSFYWYNLGEYEKAKTYHDRSTGKQGVLSNATFEEFGKLERLDAQAVILEESKDHEVLMFNTAHHTHTAYTFIRRLLPELKSLGYSHIAIESFDEERITEEGYLKISGTGYDHDPQFMKLIRSAIDLEFSVHGYGRSCPDKEKDCNGERQQALNLSAIHSEIGEGKLLVIAGFDHINEREDHPYWGKAMAAEFESITGINPFTVEQADMQSKSAVGFNNPYRKAIGLLQKPIVLRNTDDTYWTQPNGDLFDLVVFHPRARYYKGATVGELDEGDRVIHLDSLMKVYGVDQDRNYDYPLIAQLYLKDEWDKFKEEAAPYDVAFINNSDDQDNYLLLPAEQALILILRKKTDNVNVYFGPQPMQAVLVKGATVFNDHKWKKQDFYMVDGIFRDEISGIAQDTINLEGKYITPGFADGHTHNLDRPWQKYLIDQYLGEGTLYIQNLTSKSTGTQQFRKILEQTPKLKVNYAVWGFTSTLGHPFTAYEPYAMGLRDASTWSSFADSIRNSRLDLYNSYAFVDQVEQLDSIWPEYLKTKPDLTKIYYFNEEGITDSIMGGHGLRLEVAKAIIDSAHASDLQVYGHIETRNDFAKMVRAGIDGFGHMPGYVWNGDTATLEKYFIPDSLLHKAAKRGVVINPTASLAALRLEGAELDSAGSFQYDLIRRYREMNGNLIIGSDAFGSTAFKTYEYYAKQFPMSDEAVLSLISSETSMQIFPKSAIGQIENGYQADFLVFDQKPITKGVVKKPEKVFVEGRLVFEN